MAPNVVRGQDFGEKILVWVQFGQSHVVIVCVEVEFVILITKPATEQKTRLTVHIQSNPSCADVHNMMAYVFQIIYENED